MYLCRLVFAFVFPVKTYLLACCCTTEMVNGTPLFCGRSESDQLQCIFQKLGTPTRSSWPELADVSFEQVSGGVLLIDYIYIYVLCMWVIDQEIAGFPGTSVITDR